MFCKLPLVAALTATVAQVNAGWMGSCNYWELVEGHFLKFNCNDPRLYSIERSDRDSFIDLADCYSNWYGELSTNKGKPYSRYGECRGCNLEPDSVWLNCECQQGGNWARTRIDLNEDIDNDDGWPCCHNGVCAKEPPG